MGLIDVTKKSLRFLLGRRYTSGDVTNSQEAYTTIFDIGSLDVYTQDIFIPSASLPFSGSSQNGATIIEQGTEVLKFWYRHEMTKSNVDRDVWFFLDPGGPSGGVTPQLVHEDQQTNFISPKYTIPLLSNQNAEDTIPGFNVKVFKSTSSSPNSLAANTVVSVNDYQFDYKTGVLEFDANKPSSNEKIYISAYQYTGKTLDRALALDGDLTVSNLIVSGSAKFSGSIQMNGEDFYQVVREQGVFRETGSFYNTHENIGISGSTAITGNLTINGNTTSNGNISNTGLLSNVGNVSIAGNTTNTGDLLVTGDITGSGNLKIGGDVDVANGLTIAGDDIFSIVREKSIFRQTGSFYNTSENIGISGSTALSGSLFINGEDFYELINAQTLFTQTGSFFNTVNDIKITGSFFVDLNGIDDTFQVSVNGSERVKVNEEGVFTLSDFASTPTITTGGIFFSSSGDFFVGM
tara:strand:+ start:1923 stop:3314 length:1392 start_codon:yes stop_codon:yes gene_type:complete